MAGYSLETRCQGMLTSHVQPQMRKSPSCLEELKASPSLFLDKHHIHGS